jgi:threonine dehydrogenase-like Zn-dependent dehydrogenase
VKTATVRPSSALSSIDSCFVGVPHGVDLPIQQMFYRTVGVRGGGAPVRVYLPELLDDVLAERIDPGLVLDYETDLEGIGDAYAAMDERRAIKSLVRVGTI